VHEPLDDLIDGVSNAVGFRGHGDGHARILLLDEANDLTRAGAIDVEAGLEAILAHGVHDIIGCVPTLMQKIRLAFKGWNRRRDEAQKEFQARNAGWGAATQREVGSSRGAAGGASPAAGPVTVAPDIDGLVVAFLDDSGRIAYYLDSESGEVLDVRDGTLLPAPRFRLVPQRNEAGEAADRRAFVESLDAGPSRDALSRAAASGEEFRRAVAGDRTIERRWFSFKNDRVIRAVEEWLAQESAR
jgi:hypothetical protein